ncbi:MAG: hypothetical protein RR662_03935 [Clostridia bacterium]
MASFSRKLRRDKLKNKLKRQGALEKYIKVDERGIARKYKVNFSRKWELEQIRFYGDEELYISTVINSCRKQPTRTIKAQNILNRRIDSIV